MSTEGQVVFTFSLFTAGRAGSAGSKSWYLSGTPEFL